MVFLRVLRREPRPACKSRQSSASPFLSFVVHVCCPSTWLGRAEAREESRGEQRVAMAELSLLRILKFMLGPPGARFPVDALAIKEDQLLMTAQVPIILVLMFDAILAMIVLTVVLLLEPQRPSLCTRRVAQFRPAALRPCRRTEDIAKARAFQVETGSDSSQQAAWLRTAATLLQKSARTPGVTRCRLLRFLSRMVEREPYQDV